LKSIHHVVLTNINKETEYGKYLTGKEKEGAGFLQEKKRVIL
jgi:hypothetical protein